MQEKHIQGSNAADATYIVTKARLGLLQVSRSHMSLVNYDLHSLENLHLGVPSYLPQPLSQPELSYMTKEPFGDCV